MQRAYPWAMLMGWPGIETADGSGLQRQVLILDLLDIECLPGTTHQICLKLQKSLLSSPGRRSRA